MCTHAVSLLLKFPHQLWDIGGRSGAGASHLVGRSEKVVGESMKTFQSL